MACDPLSGVMCQAGPPAVLVCDLTPRGAQACCGLGVPNVLFVAWDPLMCWNPVGRDIVASFPDTSTNLHGGLGNNKEVFDAETYAIFRALKYFNRRQENGHRYIIFADSTAAINRVRSDAVG